MSGSVLKFLGDPTVSLAASAAATIAVGAATIALLFALRAIRRRIDEIEAAQAETAAYIAGEARRLGRLLSRQRIEETNRAVRNALRNEDAGPTTARAPSSTGAAFRQPLRKTVH